MNFCPAQYKIIIYSFDYESRGDQSKLNTIFFKGDFQQLLKIFQRIQWYKFKDYKIISRNFLLYIKIIFSLLYPRDTLHA